MNKKLRYEQPNVEVVVFSAGDILTLSNGFEGDWDDDGSSNGEIDLPKAEV
jgi:hypothetical protein